MDSLDRYHFRCRLSARLRVQRPLPIETPDRSIGPLATRTDNAMLTNTLSILLGITTTALLAAPPALQAAEANGAASREGAPAAGIKSGYIEAGGIRYYYEIHGQ